MADIVTDVTTVVDAEVKKMRKISKTDLKENVIMTGKQLTNFIFSVQNFQGSDLVLLTERIKAAGADKDNTFSETYLSLMKDIHYSKQAFGAFLTTAQNINSVLESLERNIDAIFTDKFITIYNTKVSQFGVYSIITQAMIFANYACYMFDGITYELVVNNGEHELNRPRAYRYDYMRSQYVIIRNLLEIGSLPTGASVIIRALEKMRKEANVNLVDKDSKVNSTVMSPVQRGIIEKGASALAFVFRWLGEWRVILRHVKYQKMIQEREWLQNHCDLLRLQLSGVDPNSDEYRKAVNIINTYNDMIVKLDQQIADYLSE